MLLLLSCANIYLSLATHNPGSTSLTAMTEMERFGSEVRPARDVASFASCALWQNEFKVGRYYSGSAGRTHSLVTIAGCLLFMVEARGDQQADPGIINKA